jgi:hypothetical protein
MARRPEIGEVCVVIDMKVSDKDVIDSGDWDLIGHDVPHGARSKIKKEPFAVTQFHHDAGSRLVVPRRKGLAPHKRDPHLIFSQLFALGK